jgi:peptidoglycan hydrolase-like protein with peptidoglycan-binding domain
MIGSRDVPPLSIPASKKYSIPRLIVAIVLLLAGGAAAVGQVAQTAWISVRTDVSTLSALSAEDKTEQFRDWALISAAVSTGQKPEIYRDLFYRFSPARVDMLRPLFQQRAGDDRWIALPDKVLLALVPEGRSADLVRIGRLSDDYTVATGEHPKEAIVFEYQMNLQTPALAIRRATAIQGESLYSSGAGYSEVTVNSPSGLAAFLKSNADLVEVRRRNDGLVLRGRKLDAGIPQLITVGDIAALEAAGQNLIRTLTANVRRPLPRIYEDRVDEQVEQLARENPDLFSVASFSDLQKLRAAIRAKNPYSEFESGSIARALQENPPTIGFSLDPRQNYVAIANDLRLLLDRPKQLFDGHLLNSFAADFQSASQIVSGEMGKLLSELSKQTDETISRTYAPEKSALTLVGLEKPSEPASQDETTSRASALSSLRLDSDQAVERARQYLNDVAESAKSKKTVLEEAIAALRAGNAGPWNSLRRYLEGDEIDVSIRRDSPKYQIKDLQEMLAAGDESIVADGSYGPKTQAAVKDFQTGYNLRDPDEKLREDGIVNGKTWRALLEENNQKESELDGMRELFNKLDQKNNRQCARYDGAIQGTEAGMTLFYTDLLMKLWSFAYENNLPQVNGFIPETAFTIDPVYWEEVKKYPATRGWLGGQPAGISYDDGGDTVRFAPVATRIYEASSSPMLNGKEVQANFSSARFSSWWNAHYWEVANYEPQYHRLNQIMKWTAVLSSFKDDLPPVLTALATQPFSQSLKFDDWWAGHKELKVHAKVPFLHVPGETTECMAILQSNLFESMGSIALFSGGVSTFKDAELAQRKLSDARRPSIPETQRQSVADYTQSTEPGKIVVPSEGQFDLSTPGKVHFAAEAKLQTGFGSSGLRERGYLKGIDSTFTGTVNELSLSVKADTTRLYDLSVSNTAGGVQIDFQPSGFLRALDFEREGASESGTAWTKVEVKNSFLVKSKSADGWTKFTPDAEHGATDKGISAQVAIGGKLYTAQPVADAEAQGLMKGTGWVEISADAGEGGGRGGSGGTTILAFTDPEPDDRDFILQIDSAKRKGRAGDEGIMVGASPGEADGIRNELDADDAAAFWTFALGLGRKVTARKTSRGLIAYASFGEIQESDASDLAALLGAPGQEHTTVSIRETAEGGVRFSADGSLELPSQRSPEDLAIAKQAISMASTQPELRTALSKLGELHAADLTELTGASKNESEAYIEMKSVDATKLSNLGLLDLRIGPGTKRAAFRTASKAGFVPIDASDAVQSSYDYVQGLVTNPDRADTIAEFRERSRPLFEHIQKASASLGTAKIVTFESGDFDVDAFVLLHGGIPGVRFVRDIPNTTQSLEHVAKTLQERSKSRLILSTVPLDQLNCATCSQAVDAIRKLGAYLPEFDEALTWPQFREKFEDVDNQQITLVARTAGDGLVFSDRWVSAMEIRYWLSSLNDSKQVLHLVTNGGSAIVSTFADSGKFDRVVLSRFEDGDIDSFAAALGEVLAVSTESGTATIRVTPDDLESLRAHGSTALAAAIQELQKRNGGQTDLTLTALVTNLEQAGSAQWHEELRDNRDWLREHMADLQNADLDQALDKVLEDRAKATDIATRRAGLELRALPLIKN